jgi:Na+-driven multidrug efflux pump
MRGFFSVLDFVIINFKEVNAMTQTEAHYIKMTRTPVERLIIRLGIPTTISMLITNIYNLVDTYFVGTLGESAQGAVGIVFTLQAIIQAFAFMLGHGSGAFVSRALANKDTKEATKYVSTAFYIGLLFGAILLILGLGFLTPFMKLLGSTETILPHAKDYAFWVLISAPFLITSMVLNNNHCVKSEKRLSSCDRIAEVLSLGPQCSQ